MTLSRRKFLALSGAGAVAATLPLPALTPGCDFTLIPHIQYLPSYDKVTGSPGVIPFVSHWGVVWSGDPGMEDAELLSYGETLVARAKRTKLFRSKAPLLSAPNPHVQPFNDFPGNDNIHLDYEQWFRDSLNRQLRDFDLYDMGEELTG